MSRGLAQWVNISVMLPGPRDGAGATAQGSGHGQFFRLQRLTSSGWKEGPSQKAYCFPLRELPSTLSSFTWHLPLESRWILARRGASHCNAEGPDRLMPRAPMLLLEQRAGDFKTAERSSVYSLTESPVQCLL